MKALSVLYFVLAVSAISVVSPYSGPFTDVAFDTDTNLRCRMALLLNEQSQCATGVSMTLENLSTTEAFSFSIYKDIRTSFIVSVTQLGSEKITKSLKFTHKNPPQLVVVSISPGGSKTWSIRFVDVLDPARVGDAKILSNCWVQVGTVIRPVRPVRLLTTLKTHVCLSIQ